MSTVKHVLEYFPTAELVLKDGRWERIDHPHKDQHSIPTELDAFNLAQEDSMKVHRPSSLEPFFNAQQDKAQSPRELDAFLAAQQDKKSQTE